MLSRSSVRELPTGAVAKLASLNKVAESVDALYPQIVAENGPDSSHFRYVHGATVTPVCLHWQTRRFSGDSHRRDSNNHHWDWLPEFV